MRCLMTSFCQQIDNDLSISRNVSSNKMIHAILVLVNFTVLYAVYRFSFFHVMNVNSSNSFSLNSSLFCCFRRNFCHCVHFN